MDNFRVLLVYVNSMMDNAIPVNLSLLSACLKKRGIDTQLFDTTCYRTAAISGDEKRVMNLQIRPFNFAELGIKLEEGDVYDDFYRKVAEFKPDLIALSVVETTFSFGTELLKKVSGLGIPNVVGGVHAIMDPEGVINNKYVDMVCTGEGEELICELCTTMSAKKELSGVRGLWFKNNGKAIKNPMRAKLVDINKLPFMDFTIYEKERFYKPMAGKIYKMVPVEMSRGCCYNCYYCCDYAFNKKFSDIGKWYRPKDTGRIFEEIDFYIREYQAQYLYFVSETFLAMGDAKFRDFVGRYRKIKLPFWFNTRPETITENKIKMLEDIGCNRISIGLEHGNEKFRARMLNRRYSNETLIRAVEILKKSSIPVSINNIMGFPDETRDLIFDTIKLVRQLELRKKDSISCFFLAPYKGTLMRKICVEKGYIDSDTNVKDHSLDYILNNPVLARDELLGLMRTFTAYCRLPEEYFPLIRKAEEFNEEGNKSFKEVAEIYSKLYFT